MYSFYTFIQSLFCFFLLLFCPLSIAGEAIASSCSPPASGKSLHIIRNKTPQLKKELASKHLQFGAPVFLRIFKVPGTLEIWIQKNSKFHFFKSYQICSYSGFLGPKLAEGDWQSPEGFYLVDRSQMNPWSKYHLSFNLGFPNKYDRCHNRTGNALMVHGRCDSMGCFAMTDYRMEEIYTLTNAALARGQQAFSVHIFPFKLTKKNLKKFVLSPWLSFWQNLKEGYDYFEETKHVPQIIVKNDRYVIAEIQSESAAVHLKKRTSRLE